MSKINTELLDETYPVAGMNNPSQGLRDNFANIKNNLSIAKKEISSLETDTIKKGTDNDFNGHYIHNATFYSCSETILKGGVLLDNYELSFNDATYHSYIIGDNINISLNDFPVNRYAKITIELTGSSKKENEVTFYGPKYSESIKYSNTWPINNAGRFLKLNENNIFIVEFWSTDAGTRIFSNLVGKY